MTQSADDSGARERADPAALEAWDRLRQDLIALAESPQDVLRRYPMTDRGFQEPPWPIGLDARAAATAADLHARYGDFVSLFLGALQYPPNLEQSDRGVGTVDDVVRGPVDPAEMRVALDGPLVMRSGETETHALLLTNVSDHQISLRTNGNLTVRIIDPETGTTVGGFSGPQILPLIIFTTGPGQTVRIPVLVGTASYDPQLGYLVPAGSWQLTAPLNLADGRKLVTAALPFTITV